MLEIGSRADVHVQPRDGDPHLIGAAQRVDDLGMPDSVLALRSSGIGFLAVPMTEPWIDPQGDIRAWASCAQLGKHVG